MGSEVEKLEKKFAKLFGSKYCVMSNSGSSANLLGIAALVLSGRLSKGDEVIVPAVSWSTTYFPLQQYGLKVKFVDIDLNTLNYNLEELNDSISADTKMIMLVNLLGNNNDFDKVQNLCIRNNIILFEDNCEAMGSSYQGKKSGTFGIIGTYSSFFSHHIATMEGGYSLTNDFELYEYMKSIRAHGWTRNLSSKSPLYKKTSRFYDKYNFVLPGYNLRPLEIEAAICSEQLDKLSSIIEERRKNAIIFKALIGSFDDLILQKEVGESSWFGFSIILKSNSDHDRDDLVIFLEEKGIEVRPIVSGNFVKNDVIKFFEYSIFGNLQNANYVHDNGFFVGNNGKSLENEIRYLRNCLFEYGIR
jgi:CDP-6-deoxy-D-xylo-4-hexulose-3-dehydrase